jgi:hypothetical protein
MGEALALDIGDVSGRSPRMSVIVRRRDETSRVDLDKDSARAVRRCVTQRPSGPLSTAADRADLEHVRAGAGLADLRSVRRYIVSAEEPAEVPTNPASKQT